MLQLSPNARWMLYESKDEGGGLYVAPFDGLNPRRQIATGGGRPVWRGDGKEILYVSGSMVMSVPVEGRDTLAFGAPRKLFSVSGLPGAVLHPALRSRCRAEGIANLLAAGG